MPSSGAFLERGETSSSAYVLGDTDLGARMKVAQALDLNERQIRRKLKRYAALHSIDAFLPLRRDPLPGSTSVHPDVERIMTEGIRAGLKLSADVGVDDLLPLIQMRPKASVYGRRAEAQWAADYDKHVVVPPSSLQQLDARSHTGIDPCAQALRQVLR